MNIRELFRNGFIHSRLMEESDEDGADLGSVTHDADDSSAGADADSAAGKDASADDEGGQEGGDETKGRTLAEEIAQSLGIDAEKKDGATEGDADAEAAGKDKPVTSLPDAKKQDSGTEKDPYAEPEWLKKTSQQAQDRFHDLVRMNKDKDAQLEKVIGDARGFVEMVRETGASQQQFLEVLDTAALMFHPEKANPQEAVTRLYNAAKQIAETAGIPLPGYDVLEAFPDLKDRVDADDLDRKTAEELAQTRARTKAQETANQQRLQQQQRQQATTNDINAAANALSTYLTERQAEDIDFPAKAKMLMESAQWAKANLTPDKWLGYMQQAYEFASKHVTKGSTTKEGHQTLRSGGGNKGSKTPGNLQEAIAQSLGMSS